MGEPWIYIVMLGIASILYAIFLPGRKPGGETANEMEAIFEQYMAEFEKENEELIDLIAGMKQDFTSKQLAQQESIVELRQRLLEVEQSNRQLAARFESLEVPPVPEESSSLSPIEPSSQAAVHQAVHHPSEAVPPLAVQASAAAEAAASTSEEEEVQTTDSLRDRYPELFELYAKGKSIDMIAKSIGIQRGEVQLILQLANREEA
ncbi:hypothetical protein D3C77_344040 [compost metagenome]